MLPLFLSNYRSACDSIASIETFCVGKVLKVLDEVGTKAPSSEGKKKMTDRCEGPSPHPQAFSVFLFSSPAEAEPVNPPLPLSLRLKLFPFSNLVSRFQLSLLRPRKSQVVPFRRSVTVQKLQISVPICRSLLSLLRFQHSVTVSSLSLFLLLSFSDCCLAANT
ncbi:uncharacterized protein G2W53_018547 [Senna tora]|uniref:Uncharacterized protein n=1 Tax=Senna tora TaxID=362788 RepID=A0A834TS06_9FABA|nr:uncharacterized protein G2W53_018547 [Senna tora]